ncbi:MAG: carboxypeptidase-like regulatory domain-containing protein [bacterium]|nr:carboxypeptidase-like regulatory domain-containing protein [bacterium]
MYKNIIRIFILIAAFLLLNETSEAQTLKGKVSGKTDAINEPLDGAVIKWINTKTGTVSDEKGEFELSSNNITDKRILVFNVGYLTDTVDVSDKTNIEIILLPNATTSVIEVEDNRGSTYISDDDAKTEVISSQELVKDACCDLSGCFGRNSSVEVAVTDIITDSKELKILGLEGAYTQILIDNMPMMNGLNVKYGVSSLPGTIIDKITISKGSNSVLQGYESISGIMNVLLKDYDNTDRFLVNGFVNSMLEKHLNMNYTSKLSKNVNNIFAFHSVQKSNRVDDNGDGFLDNPLITRYTLYNKWKLKNENNKSELNFAGRYWNEERSGGQKDYDINKNQGSSTVYGQTAKINSVEGYLRYGKDISETKNVKLYSNVNYYDQKSFFGITKYDARQTNFSVSGFYEFEVADRDYLKAGLSYKYLNIDENVSFTDTTNKTYAGNYLKKESIPGIFAENSLSFFNDKASLMTGLRFDYHNKYDLIVTPRALLRYQPVDAIVLRVSGGTGFRTLNLFSENPAAFSSSRNIVIEGELDPEKTFNVGADVLYYFNIGKFGGSINVDFYRTIFNNKIIPDYDTDPLKVIFANLKGKAYSNVMQAETNTSLFRGFDVKLAYKFIDLKYEKDGVMTEQPFNAKHRLLTTLSYSPVSKSWSASAGLQWFGKQRLPSTSSNPIQYQRPDESDPYTIINAQFNKNFKYIELYAGIENILNFTQSNPIISAEDPFSPYFDTSYIWGPTKGREFYLGFRLLVN